MNKYTHYNNNCHLYGSYIKSKTNDCKICRTPNTVNCYNCNQPIHEDYQEYSMGDGFICESCQDDYSYCYICDHYVSTDDTVFLEDKQECACNDHNQVYQCDHCNSWYDYNTTDRSSYVGGYICFNGCIDNYYSCESCDDLVHTDESNYCESCEGDYCESCSHSCDNDHQSGSFAFYTSETPSSIVRSNRFIGVEIEAEKGSNNGISLTEKLDYRLESKSDGSLINGVEVITMPSNNKQLDDFVYNACEALSKANYHIETSCGLHIHIDARDIYQDQDKLVKIIRSFYAIEDMIFSMLPRSRWDNSYCYSINREYSNVYNRDDITTAKDFKKLFAVKNIKKDKMRDYLKTRYYGLNVSAINAHQTIELRYHSGSMNPEKILYWVDLCTSIFEYAISDNYDNTAVSNLFDMATSKAKLKEMQKVFNIQQKTIDYVDNRIKEFTGYKIKFNIGKKAFSKQLRSYSQKEYARRLSMERRKKEISITAIKKEIDTQVLGRLMDNYKYIAKQKGKHNRKTVSTMRPYDVLQARLNAAPRPYMLHLLEVYKSKLYEVHTRKPELFITP